MAGFLRNVWIFGQSGVEWRAWTNGCNENRSEQNAIRVLVRAMLLLLSPFFLHFFALCCCSQFVIATGVRHLLRFFFFISFFFFTLFLFALWWTQRTFLPDVVFVVGVIANFYEVFYVKKAYLLLFIITHHVCRSLAACVNAYAVCVRIADSLTSLEYLL